MTFGTRINSVGTVVFVCVAAFASHAHAQAAPEKPPGSTSPAKDVPVAPAPAQAPATSPPANGAPAPTPSAPPSEPAPAPPPNAAHGTQPAPPNAAQATQPVPPNAAHGTQPVPPNAAQATQPAPPNAGEATQPAPLTAAEPVEPPSTAQPKSGPSESNTGTASAAPEPNAAPTTTRSESASRPLFGAGPPVEGWHEEDAIDPAFRTYRGLSIRLSAGLGLASAKRNLDKGRSQVSGFNGLITVDIGAAAIENLIVYGRLGGFALNHANRSDSPNAGNAYFGLLGAGARYHFMPIDWYASATLSLAATSVTSDLGVVENAHPGIGFELETGKDFWAGTDRQKRTVGLGLRFGYVRCGSIGKGDTKPWVGTAFSFVFSTSYN